MLSLNCDEGEKMLDDLIHCHSSAVVPFGSSPEDLCNSLQAAELSIFSQQGFNFLQNFSGVHEYPCHT